MKEDKQRKFHDALLHMLYPPPPHQEDDGKEEEANNLTALLTDSPEEELENCEKSCSFPSSGNDEKLTRAQRKRLRKRKLKEATSQRRKIIGPLLPGSEVGNERIDGGADVVNNEAEGVRRNAATNVSGEPKNNKVKRRRKSKKLAVAKFASSITESVNSDQNQGLGTDEGWEGLAEI